MTQESPLAPQRIRHSLKLRLLRVRRVLPLTPHLVRITLTGEELADFVTGSFDDHIKVFFPAPGEHVPRMPQMGPDGPIRVEEHLRPIARDYTPRRYCTETGELDIEFVLHGEGPATTWAAQAKPGQMLGIGGPRGSFVIPTAYDWHLLVGDDSALPAIARRLEELPAGTHARVVLEVADETARIVLESAATLNVQWLHRDIADVSGAKLTAAVRDLPLPPGEGYVWAAGELTAIQSVRRHLVAERGIDKSRIRAASYWKRGAVASHESIED